MFLFCRFAYPTKFITIVKSKPEMLHNMKNKAKLLP